MRTFPILQQLDSMDCGITCLRMVCKHHGKEYSFDTLSQICATARDGVSLLAISKAAFIHSINKGAYFETKKLATTQ